jgi:membrane protease subunit HflC
MSKIRLQVGEAAKGLGVDVVDVRIRRADLPADISQSIFDRMKSDRQREAAEARAQGFERSQQIKSAADRERTVILAEAQRQSEILRGEGDNQANEIYAKAYSQDPAFFALYRSLQAYKQSLGDNSTTYVLTPDSEFFKFLGGASEHR